MTSILGISAFYHDSAAALVRDGEIVSAAQEERFTRIKHDFNFPVNAVKYCLESSRLGIDDLDHVIFYDKPFIKFERILETYLSFAPRGLLSFMKAIPLWIKDKLWIAEKIHNELNFKKDILYAEHHESHAASAFFPSPFEEAAILTMDGVGEWATASIGTGEKNKIKILKELHFPHSLGLLYSAFTYYCGFKVNSGEYKLMGLAPYGQPKYVDLIYDRLLDLKEDGSFELNLDYFCYCYGLTMTSGRFHRLFGQPPRTGESKLTQFHMDIAKSIQVVTEDIILRMAKHAKEITKKNNIVLAGGVALNCVANGRLHREGLFENMWVQPAAGDAGGALGSALFVWYQLLDKPREIKSPDHQKGSFLGPRYADSEIEEFLKKNKLPYRRLSSEDIIKTAAGLLNEGNVIGWFQGRMEFGPRALGHRSIIGDARLKDMQTKMNLKIKFRESFRPFAPSVLEEETGEYFDHDAPSPYMLFTAYVRDDKRKPVPRDKQSLFGIDLLNINRSDIPAVTHVDYSARLQTINREQNPVYHALLTEYNRISGCPVIVNTSFNVRGEPIVCSPEDAYKCFMRTDMDYLVLENLLLDKRNQPEFHDRIDWKQEFELD